MATTSDQDRTIEALSVWLDGETLTVSAQDPVTMSVWVRWGEVSNTSQAHEIEIGAAGFVYPMRSTPQSVADWAEARNNVGLGQMFGDAA